MFKRYYSELYQKFYVTGKNLPFFLCSVQGKKHFFFLDLTLFLNMSPKLVPCLIMQQSTSQFPIQGSNKISPTKNIALPEQNIQTIIEATKTADDGKKKMMIWFGQSSVILSSRRVTSILRRRVCLI